jgi:hypothetical protein
MLLEPYIIIGLSASREKERSGSPINGIIYP